MVTTPRTTPGKSDKRRATGPIKIAWRELSVQLDFTVPLCGGVPRTEDVVQKWIEARAPAEKPQGAKNLVDVVAEHVQAVPEFDANEEMDKVWIGFDRDDRGLYVRGANVRAHLKSGVTVLAQNIRGTPYEITNLRQKFIDRTYIKENRVYVMRRSDGEIVRDGAQAPVVVSEPTGYRDAAMHVMTRLGPRTCLKRVDFVENARLSCTVQMLEGYGIDRDVLVAVLEIGKVAGFGQDRTLQFGRYDYMLSE